MCAQISKLVISTKAFRICLRDRRKSAGDHIFAFDETDRLYMSVDGRSKQSQCMHSFAGLPDDPTAAPLRPGNLPDSHLDGGEDFRHIRTKIPETEHSFGR